MEFEFKEKEGKGPVNWFKNLSKKKRIALIVAAVVLVLILIVVGYVMSKFSKIETDDFGEDEIIINETAEEVGVGYTNFVLFGADSRDNDVESDLNTDSIIIVSLNNATKEIKLVSVYRDTLMDMTNGNIQKCNSAYRRGGAKQAINMLNMNLDLNIQKYVTVNWSVVSEVIDMLGGVEVEVTEAEMKAMNKYIKGTAKVAGKKAVLITEPGLQTLDGVQATTYARIRKGVGDDYARTGRQRELIELALKKAVQADLVTINNIIDTVFPEISTNLSMAEILKYVSSIAKYEIVDNSGFPFNKDNATLSGRGSCAFSLDYVGDVSELHKFLFGTEDFEPSDKVKSIAEEVAYIVRTTKGSSSNYSGGDNTTTTSTAAETGSTSVLTSEDTSISSETTAEITTTETPSTQAPSTQAPSTQTPTTEAPSTQAPSTQAPSTEAPTDSQTSPSSDKGVSSIFGNQWAGFSSEE